MPGEIIQFDYCDIFQMGWNHQLAHVWKVFFVGGHGLKMAG